MTESRPNKSAYPARDGYQGATAASYDADRQRTVYDRFMWGREGKRLTDRLLRITPLGRVLDVPTGTGRLLNAIGLVASEVVGADISGAMLQLAARSSAGQVPLLRTEIELLPFRDGAFDVVVSIRFVQHLPEPTVLPILTELIRVSRRGVLIQAPIIKSASAAIKGTVDASRFALHSGSGPRPPLRVARPANRYFPVRSAEFETLLRSGGLRLASSESVTWPWSQLTLMHVVSM